MKIRTSGLSDIGIVRKENQDSLLIVDPPEGEAGEAKGVLVVVADGMGGLEHGAVASQLAVEVFERCYHEGSAGGREFLERASREANLAVHEHSAEEASGKQMGSTVTALNVLGERAWIAQVGDSRAYLLRDGKLRQVTRDHSLVQELADRHVPVDVTSEHWTQRRNIITRGLGLQPKVEVDIFELDGLRSGDTFLLSSDGFHELLSSEEIEQCISRHGDALDDVCQEFVDIARDRGGPDNITVALARLEDGRVEAVAPPLAKRDDATAAQRGWLVPLALLASFAAGVVLTLLLEERPASDAAGRLGEIRGELDRIIEDTESDGMDELLTRLRALRDRLPPADAGSEEER